MLEKIPKAMTEKFAAITTLGDAFSAEYLNEEYRRVFHQVVGVDQKAPLALAQGQGKRLGRR